MPVCMGTAVGQSRQDQRLAEQDQPPAAQHARASDDWQVVRTIFEQPAVEADEVDTQVIGEVRPDGEKFLVRLANVGDDADAAALTWDVGRYTGFRPSPSESLSLFRADRG